MILIKKIIDTNHSEKNKQQLVLVNTNTTKMDFNKHAQRGNLILNELATELGNSADTNRAGRIIRAVFHTLRDHIPQEESFQLISQLPMMLKAIYVDGWIPQKQKISSKKKDHFIEEVMRNDWFTLRNDFSEIDDGTKATKAVFRVLKNHVTKGEFENIEATLPKELKTLVKDRLEYKRIKLKNIYPTVKL